MGLIQKIFGSKNQRELNKLQPNVNRINQLEAKYKAMSDAELKGQTGELKQKLENGATLDDILCDAFAVIREASVRTTGMRHYDVQMVGGMVLHGGRIAEMRTGEGKTLVATLPTYLNALTGQGVHVVTVNDYLAKRDSEWMGRIHGFLGLRTGVIVHGLDDFERQRNYQADITYGQNNEFGFDYLRDNMKTSPDRMVQRGLNYAVVDEVDSILIDEARTPLIISGSAEASGELYVKVDRMIPRLKRDVDYTVDEKAHQAMLTDEGVEVMEKLLGVDNLFESTNIQLVHHVSNALRAHTLYKRNVNYLVQEGKVVIVDEHTGRTMPGRRWSDGLHQAIEAKEGVEVEEENQTLATVTFQNYFRMYKKLSGMTGTADTEAEEFHQIYKLAVTVIPTNKPIKREDQPDLVYKNEAGKFRAVAEDIEDCYKRGQPVLVGTVSVEKSEVVANILKSKNLPFNVLNAKQHQREASIVAQAGRKNAITIATNMAGRGTDIILGGNAEAMAKDALAEEKEKLAEEAAAASIHNPAASGGGAAEGTDGGDGADGNPYRGSSVPDFDEEKRLKELIEQFKKQCDAEREEVLAAGGLKIVGTERHESRRIDNQLRGRAGRQGDPGTSRFYLSLQDDLLRIFGLDKMTGLMERLGLEEDVPIESPMVTRSIENAQKKVEGRNFDQRKNVLEYDDVMNQQRKTIYALRRQILEGRYQPEQTDDEKSKGLEAAPPVTVSGDWSQATIRPDVEKALADMIYVIKSKVKERDLTNKLTTLTEDEQKWLETWKADKRNTTPPINPGDDRAGWRILRAEVWRQYGTLLDIERRYEKDSDADLLDYAATTVAASLIQQRERLYDIAHAQMASIIEKVLSSEQAEDEWDWEQLDQALTEAYDVPFELDHGTPDEAAEQVWPEIEEKLAEREKSLTRAWLMYFMRHFYLEEIDQQWIDHLKTMDALREGIGLQGYGQKDPKKEYKKAGFTMFSEMMDRIQENVIKKLFHVQIKREEEAIPVLQKEKERQMVERGVADKNDDDVDAEVAEQAAAARGGGRKARTAGEGATTAPVKRDRPKVGRNDPCPCGSGKKYKKCHGKDEEAGADT